MWDTIVLCLQTKTTALAGQGGPDPFPPFFCTHLAELRPQQGAPHRKHRDASGGSTNRSIPGADH